MLMRELAAQVPVARREARGDSPARDRPSPDGPFPDAHGRHRGRPSALRSGVSRFTILPSIVRWRRDLAKTSGWQPYAFGRWRCGCLAIPMPRSQTQSKRSGMRARSAKPPHLMYCAVHHIVDHISNAEITRRQTREVDELVALADEKGSSFWKAHGMSMQGCLFALTGKASDAVQMITSGIAALRSTGATLLMPLYLSYLARAYAELGQFDDAWRMHRRSDDGGRNNQGKVVGGRGQSHSRRNRADVARAGCGESGSVFRAALSPSLVNSKQNPGNSAPQ